MMRIPTIHVCCWCERPFPLLGAPPQVVCPYCGVILTRRLHSARDPMVTPRIPAALKALGVVAAGILAFKVLQGLRDEDFGDGEFPRSFRQELIDEHVRVHGCRCPGCGRRVRRSELTVDHIVALANGGRTSRENAKVLCLWCNSSKGARNSWLDFLLGRSA